MTLRQNSELSEDIIDALTDITAMHILDGLTDSQIATALENEFGPSASSSTAQLIVAGRERLNETAKDSDDLTPTELAALIDPNKALPARIVYDMATYFLLQGIRGEEMITKILEIVQKKLPNTTNSDIVDAFVGYGKAKFPNQSKTPKIDRKLTKKLKKAQSEERAAKKAWHGELKRLYMKSPAGRELKLSFLYAALWIAGALWIQLMSGNPLAPLPLIWRGHITNGKIVDVVENEVEDDRGNIGTIETYVYSYSVNGHVFQTAYDSTNLRLTEKVKYLPEDPSISRIEGVGWWHRASSQVVLGALLNFGLLFIPLYIAYAIAIGGIREFQKHSPKIIA